MRDLTLRSAQSFGSFHLIRLLFDEYIFYLVEQRIAKTTHTTPLQMLGELASNPVGRNISTTATSSISTTRINNTNVCKQQTSQYNDNIVGQQQHQQQPQPQSQSQPQQQVIQQ